VVVLATLVGRFFSGRKERWPVGDSWGGSGHLGCCSLLVIQQVLAIDPPTGRENENHPYEPLRLKRGS
jgi:hypothetical protein